MLSSHPVTLRHTARHTLSQGSSYSHASSAPRHRPDSIPPPRVGSQLKTPARRVDADATGLPPADSCVNCVPLQTSVAAICRSFVAQLCVGRRGLAVRNWMSSSLEKELLRITEGLKEYYVGNKPGRYRDSYEPPLPLVDKELLYPIK